MSMLTQAQGATTRSYYMTGLFVKTMKQNIYQQTALNNKLDAMLSPMQTLNGSLEIIEVGTLNAKVFPTDQKFNAAYFDGDVPEYDVYQIGVNREVYIHTEISAIALEQGFVSKQRLMAYNLEKETLLTKSLNVHTYRERAYLLATGKAQHIIRTDQGVITKVGAPDFTIDWDNLYKFNNDGSTSADNSHIQLETWVDGGGRIKETDVKNGLLAIRKYTRGLSDLLPTHTKFARDNKTAGYYRSVGKNYKIYWNIDKYEENLTYISQVFNKNDIILQGEQIFLNYKTVEGLTSAERTAANKIILTIVEEGALIEIMLINKSRLRLTTLPPKDVLFLTHVYGVGRHKNKIISRFATK